MWESCRCPAQVFLQSENLLQGLSLADNLHWLHLQDPQMCSHCPQPEAELRKSTEARYFCLKWGSFTRPPGCWGSLLAWDFLRDAWPSQALPSQSFVIPLLLSQVSGLCHIWRISLTTSESSPLYFHRYLPPTDVLYFWFHHGVYFLENLKLQCFLILPLLICASCTPDILFSLDVFLEHYFIILRLAYTVLYDRNSLTYPTPSHTSANKYVSAP